MKKVLSLVLALAMILGSVSMVFAVAEDVQGTKYESAVASLVDFGVIGGYPDGTFQPNKNITRAEFCKVVIKALGMDYDGSTAPTVFADVPSTHWASGYVDAAYGLGIVNGRSATVFDPEANVSYNEAIAMVVRALGYEDAHLVGSYPTAHISKASGLRILGDVPVGSSAALRGDIAQLVYNALDTKFVAYTGNSGEEVEQTDSMRYRLTGATNKTTDPAVFTDKESEDKLDVAKGTNLKAYLGAYMTYFLNEDKDTIVAVKEVKSTYLDGEFKGDKFKVGDVEYTLTDAAKAQTDIYEFVNGEFTTKTNAYSDFDGVSAKIAAKVSGKKISAIYSVQKWDVDSAFRFNDDFEDDELDGNKFFMDDNDEIDYSTFELLGVKKLEEIKKDDVVYVYLGSDSGLITKVEVGTKVVDGKITKTNAASNKYTIGSTVYKASKVAETTFDANSLGNEGTFYLDYAGKLYYFDGKSSDDLYGYAIESQNGTSSVFSGKGTQVQIFQADGTKKIFDAAKHAKTGDDWKDLSGGKDRVAIVYTLNNAGDVYEVTKLVDMDGAISGSYDVSKKGVITTGGKSYKLTTDSVIIVVEDPTDPDPKVVKASALYDTSAVDMDFIAKDGVVKFAYVEGKVSSGSDDYVLFNGYMRTVDGDDTILEIDAFVNGKATTYTAVEGNVDTEAAGGKDAVLYTLTFDGNDVDSAKAVDGSGDEVVATVSVAATDDKAAVKNSVLIVGSDSYVLSASVVVFKWDSDDEVWKLGKASDLAARDYKATLYDTNDDGEYDYVTFAKN